MPEHFMLPGKHLHEFIFTFTHIYFRLSARRKRIYTAVFSRFYDGKKASASFWKVSEFSRSCHGDAGLEEPPSWRKSWAQMLLNFFPPFFNKTNNSLRSGVTVTNWVWARWTFWVLATPCFHVQVVILRGTCQQLFCASLPCRWFSLQHAAAANSWMERTLWDPFCRYHQFILLPRARNVEHYSALLKPGLRNFSAKTFSHEPR